MSEYLEMFKNLELTDIEDNDNGIIGLHFESPNDDICHVYVEVTESTVRKYVPNYDKVVEQLKENLRKVREGNTNDTD